MYILGHAEHEALVFAFKASHGATVAQPFSVNLAGISTVITVAQGGQVATYKGLACYGGAASITYLGFSRKCEVAVAVALTNDAGFVGAEGVVDGPPQAPAVRGIDITRLHNNIASAHTRPLDFNVQFFFVTIGDSDASACTHESQQGQKSEGQHCDTAHDAGSFKKILWT